MPLTMCMWFERHLDQRMEKTFHVSSETDSKSSVSRAWFGNCGLIIQSGQSLPPVSGKMLNSRCLTLVPTRMRNTHLKTY